MDKTVARAAAALLPLLALNVFAAGDPERGKALYAVCATCHGPNALLTPAAE